MSSRSQVRDTVSAPGFKPHLRPDIQFLKSDTADIVLVHDPASGRQFEMYAMDCVIAKALDGTKDLEQVSKLAMPTVPWATPGQVRKVVIQIAGMGLLTNVQVPRLSQTNPGIPAPSPPATPPPMIPTPVPMTPPPRVAVPTPNPAAPPATPAPRAVSPPTPAPPNPGVAMPSLQRSPAPAVAASPVTSHARTPAPIPAASAQIPEASDFDEQTQVGADSSVLVEEPSTDGKVDMDSWGEEVPPNSGEVDMDAWEEEVPAADGGVDMDSWGEEVPASNDDEADLSGLIGSGGASRIAASPAVAAGQEEWEKEHVPLYKKKWFKRLTRFLLIPTVLLILSWIPYPIYVTEQCVVHPTVRADVRTQIEGVLVEVLVDEGDLVEEGQVLARLDDRDLTYELTRAQTDVERLAANLGKMKTGSRPEEIRQAKARVAAAQQDYTIAAKQHKRALGLFRNKVGSKSDVDDAKGEMQVRSRAVQEAMAALKLVQAGFRSEEVRVAEAQLRQAEAEVTHLKRKIDLLVLKAPISGSILTPKFRERLFENVALGETVVEIGDATTVRIELSVPEENADIIELGQTMEVKVHSYPLRAFKGEVAFIAPTVEERDGRRFVRVDAEVDNSEGLLLPRMTGYGEVYTGDSNVLNRATRRFVRWIRVRFLL